MDSRHPLTRLGKEINVFVARLKGQMRITGASFHSLAKFGVHRDMNAHHVAYPSIDWNGFAFNFVDQYLRFWKEKLPNDSD